ncbi:hypothetical protein [Maribacter orientalis]|uniref:hypothetical protein n=1 Tax=Maribacter orientalis TaxID=228957 RepID=UPI0015A5E091|nr:hypothetical protein [Maribacter orientalis]|tara:strand:- start:13680 stop:13853 length:174 start_codon:yes stop_codon:yes gene_type:complete
MENEESSALDRTGLRVGIISIGTLVVVAVPVRSGNTLPQLFWFFLVTGFYHSVFGIV